MPPYQSEIESLQLTVILTSPPLRSAASYVESSASDSDTTTELVALAWFGSLTIQFDGSLFFNWRSYISKLVKVFNKGIQIQFVEG